MIFFFFFYISDILVDGSAKHILGSLRFPRIKWLRSIFFGEKIAAQLFLQNFFEKIIFRLFIVFHSFAIFKFSSESIDVNGLTRYNIQRHIETAKHLLWNNMNNAQRNDLTPELHLHLKLFCFIRLSKC